VLSVRKRCRRERYQIGRASHLQRGRKTWHDRDCRSFEPEQANRSVKRFNYLATVRSGYVAKRCVLRGCHFLFHFEGMPLSDHTQVVVSKQCLDAYFRSRFPQDTGLKIGGAIS
jgi:hypothetical protein